MRLKLVSLYFRRTVLKYRQVEKRGFNHFIFENQDNLLSTIGEVLHKAELPFWREATVQGHKERWYVNGTCVANVRIYDKAVLVRTYDEADVGPDDRETLEL